MFDVLKNGFDCGASLLCCWMSAFGSCIKSAAASRTIQRAASWPLSLEMDRLQNFS